MQTVPVKRFNLFLFFLPAVLLAAPKGESLVSIGRIQGVVSSDVTIPRDHRSPLHGEQVELRGVLHQVLRWTAANGDGQYACLIQNRSADADGDPRSSDGLLVYCGLAPVLPFRDGNYRLRVGDEVTLTGLVNERFGQTELSEALVIHVKRGGQVERLLTPVDLPFSEDRIEMDRILERHEGMCVRLSEGASCLSGRERGARNGDTLVWLSPANHPVLHRSDPRARRVFRDAHPLDDRPEEHVGNGNGMRLAVGSLAWNPKTRKAAFELPELYTGCRLQGALVGSIQYAWYQYVFQPASFPRVMSGAVDWRKNPVKWANKGTRIATFNVENLYDFTDDPDDDCDFHTDSGCIGTRFPLNYVPNREADFHERLDSLAFQIVTALRAPDLLLLQEIEDQDIDGNGALDALEALIEVMESAGGPSYQTAVDRAGADERGIICAFLYNPEVFALLSPDEISGQERNPQAVNGPYTGPPDRTVACPGVFPRAMQVAVFRWRQHPDRLPLWALNNHFSSRPNAKVERRRQQTEMNAVQVRRVLERNPEALMVVGGDLNVFPRPDDPFPKKPSDQLGALYDAGMWNVYDWILERDPAGAYSYVYRGQAGTLDHLFLSPALKEHYLSGRYLHINADWSDGQQAPRHVRASDHDPLVIEFR